jgi:hypothetical protein
MSPRSLKIVIIDSKNSSLDDLSKAFRGLAGVDFLKVDGVRYLSPPPGLDAVFLLLTAAERWGSRPIAGRAQLLRTPPEDQQSGMPPYVVTGIVLGPDDPSGPIPETRLVIRTAIEAVRQFNASSSTPKIERLGFWAVDLLQGISPAELAQIFRETAVEPD